MTLDAVKQARKRHKAAIEALYEDTCTIYEMQPEKDPVTKVTEQKETAVAENKPCRLSFAGSPAAEGTDTAAAVAQEIKLFLDPEIEVKPGSKVEVEHQGRTDSYAQSGKAAVYGSHQEILLKLWKEYA